MMYVAMKIHVLPMETVNDNAEMYDACYDVDY